MTPSTQSDSPPRRKSIVATFLGRTSLQANLFYGFLPGHLSPRLSRRAPFLFLEGLFFCAVGLHFARAVGIPQSGFIAIFLAAAGLSGRFNFLLDENRAGIFGRKASSLRVNAVTAISVMMIFAGVFVAYVVTAAWLGEQRLPNEFGFALDSVQLGRETLQSRSFSHFDRLLQHNTLVLLAFFMLSFVYRAYGALLALCWNACTWAMVLTLLVWRGLHATTVPPAIFIPLAVLAVLPHLLLEAAAYVIGSLAAIFLSKGLIGYGPTDPVFGAVLRAVLNLTSAALVCLALGAFVESALPPAVLVLLR